MAIEMDADQAMKLVRQVAVQSYGSGLFEGTSGGAGAIGMIDGKPIKFNTHWKERRADVTTEMIESSNQLRKSLGEAAEVLCKNGSMGDAGDWLIDIKKALGLDDKGSAAANKSLLTRKVAAQVVKMFEGMCDADKDINEGITDFFKGVESQAKSSSGVNTRFAAVHYANGVLPDEEARLMKTEPWKIGKPVTLAQPRHVPIILQGAKDQLEKIMEGNDPGFGDRLKGDMLIRPGMTYSINGKNVSVPSNRGNMSAADTDKFMAEFKSRIRNLFGGNEQLLKFYGNFAHQGCISPYATIKHNNPNSIGDPVPVYAWKGQDDEGSGCSIDISKVGNNTYRMTMSLRQSAFNTIEVIHDEQSRDSYWLKESKDNWNSYSYQLDITLDAKGEIKLSVPKPPVEQICIMHEPSEPE